MKPKKILLLLAGAFIVIFILLFLGKYLKDSNNSTDIISEKTHQTESKQIDKPTSDIHEERHIYMMDVEDGISEGVPNEGEVILSTGVRDFLQLDIEDNQYLSVNVVVWFDIEAFTNKTEFMYEGKSVIGWRNDPLVIKYDNYVMDFKDKFSSTAEYIERYEKGEWDEMYQEYLESIANEENDLINIIKQYQKYQDAEAAYELAANSHLLELKKTVYSNEVERLTNEGIYVVLKFVDNHYTIAGELNQEEIANFPVGEYGYLIKLCDNEAVVE